MLDDFCNSQKIAYQILINALKKDSISHAYLFENKSGSIGYKMAISFAKSLFCPFNNTNDSECKNCNICNRIDSDNYPELYIINNDNSLIKKDDTDKLQKFFSTKSVENAKRIYIINNVELMNVSSANSILKFLEEPEEGIVALLVTNNIYKLLDTIVSRCQVISLNEEFDDGLNKNFISKIAGLIYKDDSQIESFVNDESSNDKIGKVIDFIMYIEKNKLNVLLYIKELWNDYFSTKDDYILAFSVMISFYKDCIDKIYGRNKIFINNFSDEVDYVINKNSFDDLSRKLEIIIKFKDMLYTNVNSNLLMDKFIIEMVGR